MVTYYLPELESTPGQEYGDINYLQDFIGMLCWWNEINRVDILLEMSLMSQYKACPCEWHLEQVLRIISYLKKKPKLTFYLDLSLPNVDYGMFKVKPYKFRKIYRDVEDETSHNIPISQGRSLIVTSFVNTYHSNNDKTRSSHSGSLILLSRFPTVW